MSRSARRQILLTFLPAICILIIAIINSEQSGLNFRELSGEGGVLSNLGIILWSASASVCFFSYTITRLHGSHKDNRFLFYSALFSSYLLFDDFFQLHEFYLPHYFGISEKFIILLLAILSAFYFIFFWKIIYKTNYTSLLLSFIFLVISVLSDGIFKAQEIIFGLIALSIISFIIFSIIMPANIREIAGIFVLILILCISFLVTVPGYTHPEYILEDGAKWLGIAFWTSYYIRTSYQFLNSAFKPGKIEAEKQSLAGQ